MLDGADAEPRGAGDGLRRVGVGADIAAEGGCFLHRRADFAFGELQAVERIVGRGDAAGHHDLHMVGALAHLLARGLADFIGAVGDGGFELQAVAAGAFAAHVGAPARIRMTARRADRLAGDIKPWTRDMSGFDRRLDAPVGPSGVADGGETAIEHGAQPARRARGDQGQRQHLHEADIDLAVDGVDVAIDQSRHQGALAAVDDIGPGRLDRRRR